MRVRHFKLRGPLIVVAASVALAGCGDDSEPDPEEPARIPAGVAEQLASLSDETAAALEGGDPCGAELVADELTRTAEAVEPRIPAQLRPEVRAGVEELVSRIECVPAPPVEEEQPPEGECPPGTVRKDEGEGKDEKKGKEEEKDEDRGEEDHDNGRGNGGDEDSGRANGEDDDREEEEKRIEKECEDVKEQ